MLGDLLILLIIGYVLYKFVSGFLLPVVRASRHVREQFRNMQESPNNFAASDPPSGSERPAPKTPKRSAKPPAEDYIDFEEIK